MRILSAETPPDTDPQLAVWVYRCDGPTRCTATARAGGLGPSTWSYSTRLHAWLCPDCSGRPVEVPRDQGTLL